MFASIMPKLVYRRLWNLCNVKAYSEPYKGGSHPPIGTLGMGYMLQRFRNLL